MVELTAIRRVLARNLRQYRRSKGLSQRELAKLAGLGRVTVEELERLDTRNPSLDTLYRIALQLDVPIHELLRDRPSG